MKKSVVVVLSAVGALFAAGQATAAPKTYKFDPNHTQTTWQILHMGTSTLRGRFDKKEGSVTIDPDTKTGHLEFTIETASIDTGVAPFTKHLSSKDFFDVETYPTARFVGDKFEFDGDKVAKVEGQLTLHGKTNPITLTATHYNCFQHPMLKREVCGGDFQATIKRSLWDMNYGIAYSSDDVLVNVQVEAVQQ